jgi:hypothetical protein
LYVYFETFYQICCINIILIDLMIEIFGKRSYNGPIEIIICDKYRKVKPTGGTMIQLPEHCPFCSAVVTTIKQYTCGSCGTTFDGHFALRQAAHPLSHLSWAQLDFVLALVRCEGQLNCLEAELGVSNSTALSRLIEIITALGGEPGDAAEAMVQPPVEPATPPIGEPGSTPRTRKQVLDDLAAGQLSPQEAMVLLRSIT